MNFLKNKAVSNATYAKAAVAAVLVTAGAAASAAAIDVSSTVTAIGDTLAPIGLIGAAVLGVVVALKAFHWVRRAF